MLSPSVFAGTLAVSESEGSEAAVSETVAPEPKKKSSFRLQRINVLTGAFVELDLVVAELKVLPYVELRFNRKK
jgi:hypothetical protein